MARTQAEPTQEQVDIKHLANHMITLTNVLQALIRDMPESPDTRDLDAPILPGDYKRDLEATVATLRELHMRFYVGPERAKGITAASAA